jgi:hypothetical protein
LVPAFAVGKREQCRATGERFLGPVKGGRADPDFGVPGIPLHQQSQRKNWETHEESGLGGSWL